MADGRRTHRAIAEAKARFAELVRGAEAGFETVLTRHGRPVARIAPLAEGVPCPGSALPGRPSDEPEVREAAPRYALDETAFRSDEARRRSVRDLLEGEIWPRVPKHLRGRAPTKAERERILGYGEGGR